MESYLTALPHEILLNILTNLDTFDVIDLCQTYPQLDQLLYDKNIIKNLRLFLEYRFEETHIDTLIFKLLETDRLMLITSLNINCVYWIKRLDLHRLISYLPALENLYAIDTKLSLTVEDCFVYNNLKQIKSIALTCADKFNWEHLDLFPKTITRMCWHIDETKYKSWNLTLLIRKLKHLEELWVINTGNNRHLSNVYKSLLTCGGLKKLVLCNSSSVIFPSTDLSPKTCVSFRRWSNNHQIVTERLGSKLKNDIYTSLNCIDQPGWDTYINRLKCTLPFGQNDAKLLILGINGIGDINYEELNLSHHGNVCSAVLKIAVKTILLNANVRLLRRLSINVCLFDDPSFEEIVGNCPLIEELEIWKCHSLNSPDTLDCLQNLKQLTKLTVDGLPDGSDMSKINKSLKSLRMKTGSNNISINLSHFSSLEDLRLEQPVLQLNAITETLPKTISRVLLKCDWAEFSTSALKSFLLNNGQLKFFGVVASKSTKKAIQRLSAVINGCKIDKRQCFFATQNESLIMGSGGMPVPHIHKQQMMAFKNQVCCVDIFNGFTQY